MSAQHTPGPLGFVHSYTTVANGGFHLYLVDSTGRKIAALWGGADEKLANAHLFSTAPELLAACELALGAFERNDCIDWGEIAAAIAKAKQP